MNDQIIRSAVIEFEQASIEQGGGKVIVNLPVMKGSLVMLTWAACDLSAEMVRFFFDARGAAYRDGTAENCFEVRVIFRPSAVLLAVVRCSWLKRNRLEMEATI